MSRGFRLAAIVLVALNALIWLAILGAAPVPGPVVIESAQEARCDHLTEWAVAHGLGRPVSCASGFIGTAATATPLP